MGGSTSDDHFGGFISHAGDGEGIVVVQVSYRLNIFGFLAIRELSLEQGGHSGNYGIQDQILALLWVRSNIARFGEYLSLSYCHSIIYHRWRPFQGDNCRSIIRWHLRLRSAVLPFRFRSLQRCDISERLPEPDDESASGRTAELRNNICIWMWQQR